MKPIGKMTLGELAAFICSHLKRNGIEVVLSGGACVSIYTTNRYESYDLDFIENLLISRKKLKDVLSEIGFKEHMRYFKHEKTQFFIEFPPGPLSVGDEPVKNVIELEFSTGRLNLISVTDCVKDRLAGYYYWNDQQSLEQAMLVAETNDIDIKEIERWSKQEGKNKEFNGIKQKLVKAKHKKKNF